MRHIAPFVAALLALLIMIGAYTFLLVSVRADVSRISAALQGSESLTQRDALARSIEIFLNDTEASRETLSEFIVKDEDIVFVIELLEDVARKENVSISISSVSVSDVSGWARHENVDVTFSVDGSFARITDFIATLEVFPFAVRLEEGTLGSASGNSWFGSFRATFIKEKI